jgi:hypothetical protein
MTILYFLSAALAITGWLMIQWRAASHERVGWRLRSVVIVAALVSTALQIAAYR